jgi:hypothetical protein
MNRKAAAVLLLGAFASAAHADLLEIAPDLFLLTRSGRVTNESRLKMDAIREALDFAKSRGMVAIPISGRVTPSGGLVEPSVYEYQFRLVTRAAAERIRGQVAPLADVVITSVPSMMPMQTGVFTSAMVAPPADFFTELTRLQILKDRGLLSPEEFESRRRKALQSTEQPAWEPAPPPPTSPVAPDSPN